jgi:hypothetical protein
LFFAISKRDLSFHNFHLITISMRDNTRRERERRERERRERETYLRGIDRQWSNIGDDCREGEEGVERGGGRPSARQRTDSHNFG